MHRFNAIRVVGSAVEVDVNEFLEVLGNLSEGVVATSRKGVFSKKYAYQVFFKGYTFYCESGDSIPIPERFFIVKAERIHSPVEVMR